MRTIGILGGVSYYSTIKYYEQLNILYNEHFNDKTSCPCIIYNLNFEEIFHLQNDNKWDEIFKIIKISSEKLKDAGADFFVIPSITLHKLHNKILSEIELPFLSFLDVLLNVLLRDNTKTLGILGTKITMEEDFIAKHLLKYEIHTIKPSPIDINLVNELIFKKLIKGIIKKNDEEKLIKIIQRMLYNKAEKILLGCTELPILLKNANIDLPLIDPIIAHCNAIFEFSINN
ncbi:amino acid racemase [bacterium]|nr:amino acid racemase [bacterium]